MNFRIYFPEDGGNWLILREQTGDIWEAKSVLILTDSEAVTEMVDGHPESYILVMGARKEIHGQVMVLLKHKKS